MKKLISTVGLDREAWLKYRKRGIGGSDAGAVCSLNPYSSPMKVYYDKTSDETSDFDNEAMRQGRDLEDYVARRFSEETGLKVRRANAIYYDEERPYMLGDFDRLVVGKRAGLECKTVSPFCESQWYDRNIPPHYLLQCYHYLAITGAEKWYIAALVYGRDFIIHEITWDDKIINSLRKIEKEFWEQYVQKGILPQPDGSEETDKVLAEMFKRQEEGKTIELLGFADRFARRNELIEAIEKMTIEKRQIEQNLKVYMGESTEARGEGYLVSWKNVASNRIDTERLKKEKPEIYSEYSKMTNSRRLTIRAA